MKAAVLMSAWAWDWIWQSTLFLGLGGLLALACKGRPARAHWILCLAMAASLATPLLSEGVRRVGWGLLSPDPAVIIESGTAVSAPAVRRTFAVAQPRLRPTASESMVAGPGDNLPSSSGNAVPAGPVLSGWFTGWDLLAGMWLVLSALALVRLAGSLIKELLIMRQAVPVREGPIVACLAEAARRLNLQVRPQLCWSNRTASPVIYCWGRRPAILIPRAAVPAPGAGDWTGILCHELAHWRRRDHWAALLSEGICCVLPWHPLVWWARRRLDQLSELACDNWVLACGQPAADYAEALLRLQPQRHAALALPVVGLRQKLEERIRNILSGRRHEAWPNWKWAWMRPAA